MKLLAIEIETPGSEDEDFRPYMKAEARRVWELHQSGMIRELYFRQDCRTAVLVLETAGPEEARQALETLPLVQAGLIEFEIWPLIPYDGFARLFEESG